MDHLKAKGHQHIRHIIAAPFIYLLIIPIVFFDMFISIYHAVCFPLYRIPKVKRSQYVKIDRYKLPYLKWWQKINCAYCEYANGLVHYAVRIGGDTEKYWCGIQHEKSKNFIPPEHQKDFIPYGDEEAYEKYEKQCLMQRDKS
jgi:hypothetical protein